MAPISLDYPPYDPHSDYYGTANDLGSLFRSLRRPPVDFVFFCTDADYTFKHVKYSPDGAAEFSDQTTEVPIIRLYGVTRDEHSVMVCLENFNPYFYMEKPPDLMDQHFENLKAMLDVGRGHAQKHLSAQSMFKRCKRYVLDITKEKLTVGGADAQSLMLYDENGEKDFLKVTVAVPRMVSNLRAMVESGIALTVVDNDGEEVRITFSPQTYEANLPYILRFLLDCNIVSGSWLRVARGEYTVVGLSGQRARRGKKALDANVWDRCSTCSIEVVAEYSAVESLPLEGEFESIGPIKIMSFDIECIKLKGTGFPNANHDPVIQISSAIYTQGHDIGDTKNFVFTLKECDQLSNATVLSFDTEDQLLLAWTDFLVQVDPDFLTGYNIITFDMPYLLTRATVLNIESFKRLTRVKTVTCNFKDAIMSNQMMGTYENKEINIEGRILFDVYDLIRRDHRLKSYTLNYVSFEFLNQQKEDVHYSTIAKLQQGTNSDRRRIASYCLKDSILPLLLINKLLLVYNYVEMARVTATPIKFLITR